MNIEQIFNYESLLLAWHRYVHLVPQDNDKDYFGLKVFSIDLEENLSELSKKLIERKYVPGKAIKYFKPKPSGLLRTITQFNIEDGLVFQCIANYIGYKSYEILEHNYNFVLGSVLNPEVKDWTNIINDNESNYFFFQHYLPCYKKFIDSANRAVKEQECSYKMETDISNFYDSIPHKILINVLENDFLIEKPILELLTSCLSHWSGLLENNSYDVGIPQCNICSPLLANIYLHKFDLFIINKGFNYTRYMDDIRIYGYDEYEMEELKVSLDIEMKNFGLTLNSSKTKIDEIGDIDDSIFVFDYQIDENKNYYNLSDDFTNLSSQDGSRINFSMNSDSDEKEKSLLPIWNSASLAHSTITDLVQAQNENEKLPERNREQQILRNASSFRQCLSYLIDNDPFGVELDHLDYQIWFDLIDKYFWRVDHWCWCLNFYKEDDEVKRKIFEKIYFFNRYDWIVSKLYECLSTSQLFSRKNLLTLLTKAQEHKSWIVRYSIYKLLIIHSGDENFLNSIINNISQDENNIKRQLLSYILFYEFDFSFDYEKIIDNLNT